MTQPIRHTTSDQVYTRPEVVRFMLDQIGYAAEQDLRAYRILEPASGAGVFVQEILERLQKSAELFGFDFIEAAQNITSVELRREVIEQQKETLAQRFADEAVQNISFVTGDFLQVGIPQKFDAVVGNPPYIRWDNIEKSLQTEYLKRYRSFRGRCDLYVPFYERGLQLLKPTGRLCLLTPNRFFKAQYGQHLRRLIRENYSLRAVWDLEHANPYQQKVDAYASLVLIQNHPPKKSDETVLYSRLSDIGSLRTAKPERKEMPPCPADRWFVESVVPAGETDLFVSLSDLPFELCIGVATGRDAVFIKKDLPEEVELEVLLPIIKSQHVKGDMFTDSDLWLINPFEENGAIRDLEQYPRLRAYFEKHKAVLQQRHIAKRKPSEWYRTIDKVKSSHTQRPKILLPDMSGNTQIFIDSGKYYPHHNIYYLLHETDDLSALSVLSAVLMSDLIREQLLQTSNTMQGGYPRWQSQNLRSLRFPDIGRLCMNWQHDMQMAYKAADTVKINELMSFTILRANMESAPERSSGQMTLFS